MSLEAHALPLAHFLGGDFPSPVEKLCRGKGLTYFKVPRRAWGEEGDTTTDTAQRVWREATGSEPPAWVADVQGRLGAGFHELLDSIALQRLRAFAAAESIAAPNLLALPAEQWVVLPAEFDGAPVATRLTPSLGEFALCSAPALQRELDAVRVPLGDVRAWEEVGEGELAADGADSRFAEKTVWAILHWLARQSTALRLPVVILHGGMEG